ncbi:MAG: hypothetical protein JWP88_1903 [Flaviaesturariibacter sp.]|nr:hypothetical protein [Flaviaesturariibacter sp.]
MKKLILLPVAALLAVGAMAQKTIHDANAEVRSVGSFHAVKVSGGIDLYLSSGDEAVAVSAKDVEYRDRIKTQVENGVLKIYYEWKDMRGVVWGNNKALKAYVSYKVLDLIGASGGSDVIIDGTVKASNLAISLSGGSDFKGKVDAQTLRIDASGGSDVDIAGAAGNLKVDVSGGSDFNGYDLVAETCNADASGGSDVYITVNKELKADASGGSDVLYRGNAATVNSSKSGGSSVKKTGK